MLDRFWNAQEEFEVLHCPIQYDDLFMYHELIGLFLKDKNVDKTSSYFKEIKYSLFALRYFWSNTIMPLNKKNDYVDNHKSQFYFFKDNLSDYFPNHSDLFDEFSNVIQKISNMNYSPLYDSLVERLDPKHRTNLIVTDLASVTWFNNLIGKPKRWTAVKPSHLRNIEETSIADTSVLFGSINHFLRNDESIEFLLTAPRSKKILLANYDFIKNSWMKPNIHFAITEYEESIYFDKYNFKLSVNSESSISEDDLFPEIDEELISSQITNNISSVNSNESSYLIDSYCYLLKTLSDTGKRLVCFLPIDKSSKVQVIDDVDGDGRLDILSYSVDNIREGVFVLKKLSNNNKSYIIDSADNLLGENSQELRSSQILWKKELERKIALTGLEKSSKYLQSIGVGSASKHNLKRWSKDLDNISIRDSEKFLKVLEFADFNNKVSNKIIKEMKIITNAHTKAGREIKKQILNKITEVETQDMLLDSKIDFVFDEGMVQFSAFEVERKLNDEVYLVNYGTLNTVMEL
jgi:hypothetical protein